VQQRPIGEVLREAELKRVDFFSLDVEGFELNVLKGMDWVGVRVNVWLIEVHETCPDKDEIRNLLRDNGYVFYCRVHWNDVWVDADFRKELPNSPAFPYPKCLKWLSQWAEYGKRWQTNGQ